jgi:molybdopterin synthase catalytic subunit
VSLTNEAIKPMDLMDLVRSPEAGAIILFAGTTRNNFEGPTNVVHANEREKGRAFRL